MMLDAQIALFPLPRIISQRFNNTFIKTIKNCISATSFIAPEIHPAAHDIEFNKAGFILFCCFAISNCSFILACNKLVVLKGSIYVK